MTRNDLIKQSMNIEGFVPEKLKYTMTPSHGELHQSVYILGHVDKRRKKLCPHCHQPAPGYDVRPELRTIRSLDLGTVMVYLQVPSERVKCPEHGVVTAELPFARANSRYTRAFEDTAVALAKSMSFSDVARNLRIDWHAVGTIVKNVSREKLPQGEEVFDNLTSIGIDETSYKKGHKYITIVVNHENGAVIYAAKDHGKESLEPFFEGLTEEQRKSIKSVTGDGAKWIKSTVKKYTPATFCIDRFHVTEWAVEAMDEVRKQSWRRANEAKKNSPKNSVGRPTSAAAALKAAAKAQQAISNPASLPGAKYALGKNPDNLTQNQKQVLEQIRKRDYYVFRAWELKEHLRRVFDADKDEVETQLKGWLSWASRCRIPEFVELGKKIRRHMDSIINTVKLGLSNARIEAVNNKIKVLIRRAYGFRNVDNLIALVKLFTAPINLDYPGRGCAWDPALLEKGWIKF